MSRGRQKGQTKKISKIVDELISPYEIYIEEDQFVIVDSIKNKPLSYHGSVESAIKTISNLSLVRKEKIYTLTGFMESYKNIVKQLTSKFKIEQI